MACRLNQWHLLGIGQQSSASFIHQTTKAKKCVSNPSSQLYGKYDLLLDVASLALQDVCRLFTYFYFWISLNCISSFPVDTSRLTDFHQFAQFCVAQHLV